MGSGSKKHKRDRDAKKHKHKSLSNSPEYPVDRDVYEKEKERRNHHHKYRSSKSRSPPRVVQDSRAKYREKEKRHGIHKRHRDRRNKHQSHASEKQEEYHSDSSDVIEVPLAPPAPIISKTKSPDKSPIDENGAGDCLSVEETNKLRAKLGLKPLEVDSGPIKESSTKKNAEGLSAYKDEWGEFLHKPAANLAKKKEAEKIREKIKQQKEKRTLEQNLKKIRGLAESDDEVDDINKWLKNNKKRDELRKEAERRAKTLEEMDAEFGVGNLVDQEVQKAKQKSYSDRHLKGLRVEHDLNEFTEGRSVILTLKDQEVLGKDSDTLINVNLLDDERYKRNVETKKQSANFYGYNVYEEKLDEYGLPVDRSILDKYDEEIGGPKKGGFTIGESIEEQIQHQRKILEIKTKLAGKRLETLDNTLLELASDTYNEAELEKFKKPKRKVKKIRQKLKADDLLPLDDNLKAKRSDFGRRKRVIDDDISFNDTSIRDMKFEVDDEDDDLERVLSKARKLKQKEAIIVKSFPIDSTEIKQEIKIEPNNDESDIGKDGHITLNATAEFCRTLGDIPTYGMAGNRDEDSNDMMDFEEDTKEIKSIEPDSHPTSTWNSVNPDAIMRSSTDDNSNDVSDVAILDEEPDVGSGVAAALQLAVSKGYLEKEDTNRPSNSRMAHLQAKNYSIEDKSYAEDDKFGRRDRYHSGPIMDFREKDTFKPNVKLEYIDDNGRVLNAKEAFRYLSHKFHGKGPGKNKIEKRLKKTEQEGLMMKMSSTDTPLGTLSMLQHKQKETQTPYVVLSGSKQSHVTTSIAKHK